MHEITFSLLENLCIKYLAFKSFALSYIILYFFPLLKDFFLYVFHFRLFFLCLFVCSFVCLCVRWFWILFFAVCIFAMEKSYWNFLNFLWICVSVLRIFYILIFFRFFREDIYERWNFRRLFWFSKYNWTVLSNHEFCSNSKYRDIRMKPIIIDPYACVL